MLDCASHQKTSSGLQVSDDLLVCILNIGSHIVFNDRQVLSVLINGDWRLTGLNKTLFHASVVILLTKAWSLVNNTGTCIS